MQHINDVLNNTQYGKAISTGRKQLVADGDYVSAVFKDNSVPVKKSGIRVQDGVVSGEIGWDIPAVQDWDDWLNGKRTYGGVIGDTGVVGVPTGSVTGESDDGRVIEYPEDTPIQDTRDYPKTDDDKPEEIPEKPQKEVIEEQGGEFYPTEFDLTNLFPFCIPFDIVYLVQKFDASGENAPVITIPIVYPEVMQSSLGTDRYNVVIDFSDFLVLRNIIRVFLLIGVIIGLLKITRDIIRG